MEPELATRLEVSTEYYVCSFLTFYQKPHPESRFRLLYGVIVLVITPSDPLQVPDHPAE